MMTGSLQRSKMAEWKKKNRCASFLEGGKK